MAVLEEGDLLLTDLAATSQGVPRATAAAAAATHTPELLLCLPFRKVTAPTRHDAREAARRARLYCAARPLPSLYCTARPGTVLATKPLAALDVLGRR